MKRIIKLVSMSLAIMVCISSMLFVVAIVPGEDAVVNDEMAFALSEGLILNENLSNEEQIEVILNSKILSEKQKSQAVDKLKFTNSVMKANDFFLLDTTVYNFTAAIPYFKQQNSYYCGPATTKQSLHYISGTSPTQSVIANGLGTTTAGTDGAMIVTYMNANQSEVYYIDITPANEADMASRIYRGMSFYGSAPILRLKMTTGQGWDYASSGHFMNASGIYSSAYSTTGALQYEVTDPYIQYIDQSETDGKYRISSTAVYNSTINHFAQKFYY